jgi:hypothetical protein
MTRPLARADLVLVALALLGLAMLVVARVGIARAEDMPVFRIEMKDGTITPSRLTVPAGRPFKLDINNAGDTPAEFESLTLHKEKVLPGKTASPMVIFRLEPGEYEFFDDFHPGSKAVLVAQ